MKHKEHPYYHQDGITEAWEPLSDDMRKGLELAAYICRMYQLGGIWADTILSHGEQVRGRFHMIKEAREKTSKVAGVVGVEPTSSVLETDVLAVELNSRTDGQN